VIGECGAPHHPNMPFDGYFLGVFATAPQFTLQPGAQGPDSGRLAVQPRWQRRTNVWRRLTSLPCGLTRPTSEEPYRQRPNYWADEPIDEQ
jgi:hypothetical protein